MEENIIILDEVKDAKLSEAQKKLAKHIVKKIVVGIVVAVVVTVASDAIVSKLKKDEDSASTEESTEEEN